MTRLITHGVVLLVLVCSAISLLAQDTASLTGTVTDPSGAAVANAQVSVDSAERGIHRSLTTNEAGEYGAPALPAPASYDITVTAPGFKKYAATAVALRVAEKTRVNVKLEVGASTTEVTVIGATVAQVETQSSDLGSTVTGKEISQLQLNGRNFTQLVTLVPGVSNQTGQDEGQVGITGSVQYSMNGGRVEYNNWELDGGDNMDNGSNGSLNVYPSIDAIAEFKVLTSNYGAQYGRNGSGTVEVETKSGTSAFHGDVYEFVRNDVFNARGYFQDSVPAYKKNDFGYTIGGPIYIPGGYNKDKQKTFFFWSQEWRRERVPATFNQAVPYSAERSGNFSDLCPDPGVSTTFQRDDPEGANYFPDCPGTDAGGGLWNIFPNNLVTVDPVAQALLPLIPVGTTDVPGASIYNTTATQPTTWREELLRIDHNLTEHHRLTFRYVHDSWETVEPTTIWTGSAFPTVRTGFNGPGISLVARLTSTLSPGLLNEFVAGYTTDHISFKNSGTAWQRPANLPMGSLYDNGFGGKVPTFNIGGGAAYNGGFYVDPSGEWPEGAYNSNPTYTYRDNMTKIVGRHNLQFGAYFVAAQKNELSSLMVNGNLSFDPGSPVSTGNAFADLLMGQIASFSQGSNQVKFYNRYKIFEPYFQDDFRITKRLTLNLGLRLSLLGTYREKYKHAYNWDPAVYRAEDAPQIDVDGSITGVAGALVPGVGNPLDGLVQCGAGGVPVGCSKGHLFNPAPRIGFAFDPRGDGKTAIRGGYGIFFEHSNGNEANTEGMEGQSSPLLQSASQSNISGYLNIGGGGELSPAFPFSFISIPRKVTWPYMQQWHFDIQHEMLRGTVMTISYVGSKGTHLGRQTDLNQLRPVTTAENPYTAGQIITQGDCDSIQNAGFPDVSAVVNGQTITGQAAINLQTACGNDANPYRPFYGLSTITRLEPAASSSYHALQTAVRRSIGGLTVNASYTYSHSIDDASDRYDGAFVDSYNPRGNRASSSFDTRHALTIGYVYDLPLFKAPGLTHTLLGGWQWSGIVAVQTGTPFTVVNASTFGDNAGVGNGVGTGSYADRVGDPNANIPPPPPPGSGFGPFLYNPDAYATPQGLTFGTSGRNSLRNPRRTNFDMALFKHFAIKDKASFEFRAEAFNVFNHTQWAALAGDAGSGASNFSSGTNSFGSDNFLQIGAAHSSRILQLGAKFIF